ncbi:protein of unknown function [Sterolibacterium denitrificans]|uniref:Uncharacterized protein n=1 Tax=Sterolibacterium denitrificans TaxID=157592 RepID=A0A7Z7MW36_9PROT|nr:hypothetical protein [Sterolibacterium denitrificans]SMB28133.1 protein of unknown function [Sterolibacterium denitrificans]
MECQTACSRRYIAEWLSLLDDPTNADKSAKSIRHIHQNDQAQEDEQQTTEENLLDAQERHRNGEPGRQQKRQDQTHQAQALQNAEAGPMNGKADEQSRGNHPGKGGHPFVNPRHQRQAELCNYCLREQKERQPGSYGSTSWRSHELAMRITLGVTYQLAQPIEFIEQRHQILQKHARTGRTSHGSLSPKLYYNLIGRHFSPP